MKKHIARSKKPNNDNATMFLERGINLDNRVIHLSGEIDSDVVTEIIKGMQLLIEKNKEPISLFINTFGGCPYSSFALYDFIKSLEDIIVKTYNIGCCMSGGTIIFLAGDERYMFPNAVFMFHTVSSTSEGKLHELVDESDECKKIFKQMIDVYSKNGKLTTKDWTRRLKYHNIYMRAKEAKELGIVTDVVKYEE